MFHVKNDRIKIFEGRIGLGLGAGRGNLAAQLPRIALEFPAIKDCYFGTINLKLTQPLHISKADHTTKSIEWMKGVSEKFSLIEVEFEYPTDGPHYKAWIYKPQYSPHRLNQFTAEIIAPPIPEVTIGQTFRLYISRSKGRIGSQKS